MIAIGLGHYARTLGVLTVICERCSNPAPHRVVRRTRRIVLLFVPLLPVARSWGMTCTHCAQPTELTQVRVYELLAGAAPRPVPRILDARPRP